MTRKNEFIVMMLLLPFAWVNSEETTRNIFSVPYEYTIAVNETVSTPSVETGISTLENATRTTLNDLVGDSEVVRVAGIESTTLGKSTVPVASFPIIKT